MKNRIEIEETLHDVYTKTDLLKFEAKLAAEKQLTRLEHFDVVTDDELVVGPSMIDILLEFFSRTGYQYLQFDGYVRRWIKKRRRRRRARTRSLPLGRRRATNRSSS